MTSHTLAKQDNGQFQITFTIKPEDLKKPYQTALENAAKNVDIKGFRKGKAPINKVEEQIDKSQLYQDALNQVLPDLYAKAIEQEKMRPIISPQVRLLKADPDTEWQVQATSAELPPVELKDSLKTLKGLLKGSDIWTPNKGEATSKTDQSDQQPAHQPSEDEKVSKIIDHLLEHAEVKLPEIIVQQEVDRQLTQLLTSIEKLGLKLEQYLASTGKDVQQLRQEYQTRSENELKIEFMLGEIARSEKITVTDDEIKQLVDNSQDEQMKHALENHPEAKTHLYASLLKRKTFEHLLKIAS